MKILAISNQKGGVGKTTSAVNLAAYLSARGRDVLLVDLDPQANATSGSGHDKTTEPNIYSLISGQTNLEDVIIRTDHDYALLPAHPGLAAAEVELASHDSRDKVLKEIFKQAAFDYVIIDCPPSLGLLTINALSAADHLIIPVQAEYYALEGLGQLLDTVSRIQQSSNPNLNLLGVLLTMHSNRTTLSNQVHDEVRKHFGPKVFDAVIPRNVRLAEAPSFGRPISKHDKWSRGARSYKQFAKEVENRLK